MKNVVDGSTTGTSKVRLVLTTPIGYKVLGGSSLGAAVDGGLGCLGAVNLIGAGVLVV